MRGEWTRRALIWVHAESTIITGLLIIFGGPERLTSQSFDLMRHVPCWPAWWGLWACLAGSVIGFGMGSGRIRVTNAGLILAASWYAFVTANFAFAATNGQAFYPVSVYLALTSLAIVHAISNADEIHERAELRRELDRSRNDLERRAERTSRPERSEPPLASPGQDE